MNAVNAMNVWSIQVAQARFGEMFKASLDHGPQTVSYGGTDKAVLVSLDEWRELNRRAGPSLHDIMMQEEGRTDDMQIPSRDQWRWREPMAFD